MEAEKMNKKNMYDLISLHDTGERRMTVFISGPITRKMRTYQYSFADAQMVLEFLGYTVLNPAWLPKGLKAKDYEKINDAMLEVADAICLLKGWEDSKGAKREALMAEKMGKTVITYDQLEYRVEKKVKGMQDHE